MTVEDIKKITEESGKLTDNLRNRNGFSQWEIIEQLRKTFPQLVRLNMQDELKSVMPALMDFVTAETTEMSYNSVLPVYKLIGSNSGKKLKTDLDFFKAALEKRFNLAVSQIIKGDETSLHDAIEMGKLLARYYSRKNNVKDVDNVLGMTLDAIESSNKKSSGLASAAIYKDLATEAYNLGRRDIHKRISRLLEENADDVYKGMSQIQEQKSIPQSLIDCKYMLLTFGKSESEAIDSFVLDMVPDEGKLEEYKGLNNEHVQMLGIFQFLYFRDSGNLAYSINPENKEEQDYQLYTEMIGKSTILLELLIRMGKETGLLSIDNIMDYISASPVLSSRRIEIIEKGIRAFLEQDYIISISVLVPQIENMIRSIYRNAGIITTSNDTLGTQSDGLGTLLNNPDAGIFKSGIKKYLQATLSFERGWNLRNEYCHGLTESFNIVHADRLFHIMLLLVYVSKSM